MAIQRVETLLERTQAVGAIDGLIAETAGGRGSALAIEGAAGVGKSALVQVAVEHAAPAGIKVASARGGELERDNPFGIVRQLLGPVVAAGTASERRRMFDGAAQLAPPLIGLSPQPGSTPAAAFKQAAGSAMYGLYWLVVNLAEREPLLLCVDDGHWGDSTSLGWLHYLVRRLEDLPIGLLIATRPGQPGVDSALPAAIAAEPLTRVVRLDPLSPAGSGVLVRRALGIGADDEFCAACHAVSGGNPFLLKELTRALSHDGVTPTAESVPRVREVVPEAVVQALLLRMARLPGSAGGLARADAVLGGEVSLHNAAAVAELEDDEASEAAAALAAAAILAPGLPLDFVHPLVRAAVYDAMHAAERTVWHVRAARVLAAGGAPPGRVAAHLMRVEPAGDPWVVTRLREAAAHAMARADSPTALAFLKRGFVEPVPAGERVALLEELAAAGFAGMDRSAEDALDIDVTGELAAEPRALQSSAPYLVMGLWSAGRTEEAKDILERALSTAKAGGEYDLALRLEIQWIMLGQLLPRDAMRQLEPYAARVAPDSAAGRLVDASLTWYGSLTGCSASETLARGRRAFAGGLLISELQDDSVTLSCYALGLLRTDELGLCEQIIDRTLDEGRGLAATMAAGSYLTAHLAYLRGDLLRGEGHVRAAIAAYKAADVVVMGPVLALLVDALVDRGDLDAAATELADAGMEGSIPEHWWFGPVLWSRGYLRLAQGRTREATEDLLEFGERCQSTGIVATVTRPWASHAAPVLAQLGARDEALRLARRELDEARGWGTPRVIGQALRGLGLVTGGADGIELLRESVRTLGSSPARLEHARALSDLGAALRRAGQRREAREPLRRGLDLAHRCGARLLAQRANQELRVTGAKPRRHLLTGVEALTASELRIAELATEGLTNREIAQVLFVTVKTVEMHMTHVFQKLGIGSRTKLGPVLSRAVTDSHRTVRR